MGLVSRDLRGCFLVIMEVVLCDICYSKISIVKFLVEM